MRLRLGGRERGKEGGRGEGEGGRGEGEGGREGEREGGREGGGVRKREVKGHKDTHAHNCIYSISVYTSDDTLLVPSLRRDSNSAFTCFLT